MITDELFGLKAESIAYFTSPAARANATTVKRLMRLAISESLYTARILTLMGGHRHKGMVLQISGVLRVLKPDSLPLYQKLYAVNREVTISLAELHFGSRRGRTPGLPYNRAITSLFEEIVASNHAALVRLRRDP
jgi:hypothetical protein